MTDFAIRVECYAGHRGEEEPHRFWIGEREVEVVDILDRWLDPAHRYFKVSGKEAANRPSLACGPRPSPIGDSATYIVRHDTGLDRWELTLYEQAPGARRS